MRHHAALVLCLLCGCAGSYRIERTVGGAVRSGPFVPPYAYEHYMRGELALAAGDPAVAAGEFELARSGADDDALVIARLATALHLAGNDRGAAHAIEDGLALDPTSEAVHLAAGAIDEAHGDLESALEHYERALRSAPRSADAIEALVGFLERTGDSARAARVLAQHADSAGIEVAIARSLAEGDPDQAIRLVRLSGPRTRSARVRTARAFLSAQRPVLAAEVLAPLSDSAPRTSEERAVRIDVATSLGDIATAEALLAVPLEAGVAEELADARAFLAVGAPERAEELARSVAASTPSFEADVVLAQALFAEGHLAEAAALLAAIPDGASVHDEAVVVLARVLARAGLPALGAEVATHQP